MICSMGLATCTATIRAILFKNSIEKSFFKNEMLSKAGRWILDRARSRMSVLSSSSCFMLLFSNLPRFVMAYSMNELTRALSARDYTELAVDVLVLEILVELY